MPYEVWLMPPVSSECRWIANSNVLTGTPQYRLTVRARAWKLLFVDVWKSSFFKSYFPNNFFSKFFASKRLFSVLTSLAAGAFDQFEFIWILMNLYYEFTYIIKFWLPTQLFSNSDFSSFRFDFRANSRTRRFEVWRRLRWWSSL